MRKEMMAQLEYEQPQMTMILLDVEHGFASSAQLEDMKESEGQWEY